MRTRKLTTLILRKKTEPGRYSDGGNLYLFVKAGGARVWTFRYTLPGQKPREMSLGNEADVTLAEARERARDACRELEAGRGPIEARNEARREAAGNG